MSDTQSLAAEEPASSTSASPQSRAYWSGVFAMTLCVFTLIASEFMPVSLLTAIASDLGVSTGLVGQGIAISGAFAVITSLSISTVAAKHDRKHILLGLTALMLISGAIIAEASSYLMYMVGRSLIGVSIGGFWSLSAACAMRLVPKNQVPKALAIFNGGNALAMILAAPLGSYLGSIVGWRGAFWCLVPLSLLAFIWQYISLPAMRSDQHSGGVGRLWALIKTPVIGIGMAAVGLFFMGQFTLYTYIRPFLETVTQIDAPLVSLSLLIVGIAGFVGTALIGRFLNKSLYGTLIIIPLLMAVIGMSMMLLGHSFSAVAVALACWGLLATAAPVGWWTWVARIMPDDSEAGGGMMVAVIQLTIALGSTLGGILYDFSGHELTFSVAAIIMVLASGAAYLSSRGHVDE